jgi:DNA-binding NtrC family response regulator
MSFVNHSTASLTPDRRRTAPVVALRRLGSDDMFPLDEPRKRWTVGSSSSCDIALHDPFVSAVHCVIERRPSGVIVVRDHRSRNGTFVDGHPIEGAELRVGCYLSVGRTTLVAMAATGSGDPRALDQLRGRDPVLRATVDHAVRAAPTDCAVLIVGETGTGKDLLARVIHESGRRAGGPFVAVNCGAIPRELIGSELFGHDKGAFTGATLDRDGYFVEANGGTLFLDEIGELPIELQPNLLRALETKKIRRVGGQIERQVDVRIVAATNRIEGLGTESSRLRVDLYHRLATVVLALPPLRERMADLRELVESQLDECAAEFGVKQLSVDAWRALASYSWPGNVRELRHAVARAVALGGDTLEAPDFFQSIAAIAQRPLLHLAAPREGDCDPDALAPYEELLRDAMALALQQHGSIRAAASSIGMPKSTFADRAKAWGLAPRAKIRVAPPADGERK